MPRKYREISSAGTEHCSVKLPVDLRKLIDKDAKKRNITRSHWMVLAAEAVLQARKAKKAVQA